MVTWLCKPTPQYPTCVGEHFSRAQASTEGRNVLCIVACQVGEPQLMGLHMALCMHLIPRFACAAAPTLFSASVEPRGKHGCCQTMSQATHGDTAIGPLCSDLLVAITSPLSQESNPQQTHNPEQGVAQHPKITLSFPAGP